MIGSVKKDPSAVRIYAVNWSQWTGWKRLSGRQIADVVWTITPNNNTLVKVDQSIDQGGMKTLIKLKGGIPSQNYVIECHMTPVDSSSPPVQDSRRFEVSILPL